MVNAKKIKSSHRRWEILKSKRFRKNVGSRGRKIPHLAPKGKTEKMEVGCAIASIGQPGEALRDGKKWGAEGGDGGVFIRQLCRHVKNKGPSRKIVMGPREIPASPMVTRGGLGLKTLMRVSLEKKRLGEELRLN